MEQPLVTVETTVNADAATLWNILTQKKSALFMGAEVDTDWRAGSPLTLTGEFNGKSFKDHGEIRDAEPQRHLAFTHFSGSGEQHGNLVDMALEPNGDRTRVSLSQTPLDGERPDGTKVAEFRKNWEVMLGALKNAAEDKTVEVL